MSAVGASRWKGSAVCAVVLCLQWGCSPLHPECEGSAFYLLLFSSAFFWSF